jgi:DNA-binding transcriptional ArsR family regulator
MPAARPHDLDRTLLAMSDPARRRMLERLSHGPATVTELAEPLTMRLPSAVKHLKVLEEGGIVLSSKAGRTRTYRIRPDAFDALNAWVRQREAAMHAAFDRLTAAIEEDEQEKRQ